MKNILRQFISETLAFDMTKSIEYTALVLDDKSRAKLRKFVPDDWNEINHHVTLISPGEGKISINDRGHSGPGSMKLRMSPRWIGSNLCFTIDRIAMTNTLVTAKINLGDLPLPIKGPAFPHVTIATNGVLPEESNKLTKDQFETIEPIQICGVIKEIPYKGEQ